jgi:hypothetical protein
VIRKPCALEVSCKIVLFASCSSCAAEEAVTILWVAALIIASIFALANGQGLNGKLINLAIILGCMALGFGIGHAAGLGSSNLRFGAPGLALPFSMIFGIVGALAILLRTK